MNLINTSSKNWSAIDGGITAPNGFKASGISAGLKNSKKMDLGLILAPKGSICSGTFTQSSTRASCIDICLDRLRNNSGKIRAILINSGQANAFTGSKGLNDCLLATSKLAKLLNLNVSEVLMSSTGVIGERIKINNLLNSLNYLVNELSDCGGSNAAEAILTTDLVQKQIAYETYIDGYRICIGGMAKGSGMIHPNMATMLSYLTCDAFVPHEIWDPMIKRVVKSSFNAISVDGDTSTNDTFLAVNSGKPISEKYFDILENGLLLTAQYLAKSIARDGEGANCLLEVTVRGTRSNEDAINVARIISSSSLVKTAINGCDPNWGRIIAALGRSNVKIDLDQLSLWIGENQILENGEVLNFDKDIVVEYLRNRLKGEYMKDDKVSIFISVGTGQGFGQSWGCDLSTEYIRINADYTT